MSGTTALIESRLLLSPDSADPSGLHYVVGVTLDGQEYDWRALQATPDTGVRVDGRVVGDRDRIEVPLTPGAPHEVTVRLVATQGGRLLVRIRQADRPDE